MGGMHHMPLRGAWGLADPPVRQAHQIHLSRKTTLHRSRLEPATQSPVNLHLLCSKVRPPAASALIEETQNLAAVALGFLVLCHDASPLPTCTTKSGPQTGATIVVRSKLRHLFLEPPMDTFRQQLKFIQMRTGGGPSLGVQKKIREDQALTCTPPFLPHKLACELEEELPLSAKDGRNVSQHLVYWATRRNLLRVLGDREQA